MRSKEDAQDYVTSRSGSAAAGDCAGMDRRVKPHARTAGGDEAALRARLWPVGYDAAALTASARFMLSRLRRCGGQRKRKLCANWLMANWPPSQQGRQDIALPGFALAARSAGRAHRRRHDLQQDRQGVLTPLEWEARRRCIIAAGLEAITDSGAIEA